LLQEVHALAGAARAPGFAAQRLGSDWSAPWLCGSRMGVKAGLGIWLHSDRCACCSSVFCCSALIGSPGPSDKASESGRAAARQPQASRLLLRLRCSADWRWPVGKAGLYQQPRACSKLLPTCQSISPKQGSQPAQGHQLLLLAPRGKRPWHMAGLTVAAATNTGSESQSSAACEQFQRQGR